MNYIHQLKRGIAVRDAQIRSMDNALMQYLAYLNGPKFTGFDERDGERKDWISTSDVIHWIRETRSASIIAGETEVANFTPNPQVV